MSSNIMSTIVNKESFLEGFEKHFSNSCDLTDEAVVFYNLHRDFMKVTAPDYKQPDACEDNFMYMNGYTYQVADALGYYEQFLKK